MFDFVKMLALSGKKLGAAGLTGYQRNPFLPLYPDPFLSLVQRCVGGASDIIDGLGWGADAWQAGMALL